MNVPHRLFVSEDRSDRGETVHLEREPRDFPITLEGSEPVEPTSWDLILAGARWVLLAFALIASLLAAAGFFFNN